MQAGVGDLQVHAVQKVGPGDGVPLVPRCTHHIVGAQIAIVERRPIVLVRQVLAGYDEPATTVQVGRQLVVGPHTHCAPGRPPVATAVGPDDQVVRAQRGR